MSLHIPSLKDQQKAASKENEAAEANFEGAYPPASPNQHARHTSQDSSGAFVARTSGPCSGPLDDPSRRYRSNTEDYIAWKPPANYDYRSYAQAQNRSKHPHQTLHDLYRERNFPQSDYDDSPQAKRRMDFEPQPCEDVTSQMHYDLSEKHNFPPSGYRLNEQMYLHRRLPSSGSVGDDRTFLTSDPGSDLGSELSDLLNHSLPPFGQHALQGNGRERADSMASTKAAPPSLPAPNRTEYVPEFVMDELKRLKLENMALKQLANEIVRVNHMKDLSDAAKMGASVETCDYHPPLETSPMLERLLGRTGSAVSNQEGVAKSQPTAFSPAGTQLTPRLAQLQSPPTMKPSPPSSFESAIVPEQRAGLELSKRLRSDMPAAGSPFPRLSSAPEYLNMGGAGTPVEESRRLQSLSAIPGRLQQPRSGPTTPPKSSPVSSPASLQRLESVPATTLVNMILERRGQEASLLLQQQLKSASPERQEEIYEAVRSKIFSLSQDRHGNFLVQRILEVRPEMAQDLRHDFVDLAMSQFGCHVVQKVLEGGEDIQEIVAEELLDSKLEQTLTSRNSIHVWQRILEIDWKRPEFRSKIFSAINEQLKGKWAQTARQETGSIICQNIFESAQDSEKEQCMKEVLEQLDECATNQWGVWVVQHIIEHGADQERKMALEKMLRSAVPLTLSQYGQKAIMSGLKSGESWFVEDYVSVLCQTSGNRRPALVDVCLSPHGIQIVTQLLTTVSQQTRDKIISAVRRNSVFLKGSKTGMKVHQLCERARAFAGY